MEDARSLWQLAPGHRAWVGELSAQGELRRQLRLQGGIQRRTMLRHLIILNGPAI